MSNHIATYCSFYIYRFGSLQYLSTIVDNVSLTLVDINVGQLYTLEQTAAVRVPNSKKNEIKKQR